MTTAATREAPRPSRLDPELAGRILQEGYGPGAWHGPDLKAAIGEVTPELAFWRPGKGRHNIAEIVVHHAWCVRSVASQLSGEPAAAFPLEGEDWFALSEQGNFGWPAVGELLERQQDGLVRLVRAVAEGGSESPLSPAEQLGLILGITCHAVYHAGQIQLIKALRQG